MRVFRKSIAILLLVVVLASFAPVNAEAFSVSPNVLSSSFVNMSWRYDGGNWRFVRNGVNATGWQLIGNVWYHFNSAGVMSTGWVFTGGQWYFMRSCGAMATGWVFTGGQWYFMRSCGAMAIGWVFDSGQWYFMHSCGAMATGWVFTDGQWYFMRSCGAMATGWVFDSGQWYFMRSCGAMATGDVNITGTMHRFSSSGAWLGELPPPPPPRYMNPLTGLLVHNNVTRNRPIAVQFSNSREALPQHGISQADIIYEALVEGGITRMLALYQDISNVGNLGSIRSARPYFMNIVHSYDAIFVHGGGSPVAMNQLRERNVNRLDGVYGPGANAFFRLAGREHQHALFTTGARINQEIGVLGYRRLHNTGFEQSLSFASDGTPTGGRNATTVNVRFSAANSTTFRHNSATNLYYVTLHNGAVPYVDGNNGRQVAVTNVLILRMETSVVPGDDAGRLDIKTTFWGSGYYINGGRQIPIRWRRAEWNSQFEYFLSDYTTPLVLGQGRTYICIVPINAQVTIS